MTTESAAQGRVLPEGSPLVQFEVRKNAHGSVGLIPEILWGHRTPVEPGPSFAGCRPVFPVPGQEATSVKGTPRAVCLCMGNFIE